MNRSERNFGGIKLGFAAFCLSWVLLALPAIAADNMPYGFDSGGEKIFTRYNKTPLSAMSGTDGKRNLNSFYELRQYPGSPPGFPTRFSPPFQTRLRNVSPAMAGVAMTRSRIPMCRLHLILSTNFVTNATYPS